MDPRRIARIRDTMDLSSMSDTTQRIDETCDIEEGADESQPLLSQHVTFEVQRQPSLRQRKTTADNRRRFLSQTTRKLQIGSLDQLQDVAYCQDHFKNLAGEEVARAASLLLKLSDGTLDSEERPSIDGREEYQEAMIFKRRSVKKCTLLHFAIWFVAEHSADASIVEDVLQHLSDPDDVFWPASYPMGLVDGVKHDAYASAVHIAAGLGQVSILKMLLKHAMQNTSPDKRMKREEFVSEWALKLPQDSPREDYLDRTNASSRQLYYQPIHDSTYAGNGEVTLWLLRNRADPCSRNDKDITPLHFVAFSGLMGGLGTSLGDDLAKVVKELQRTGKAVGAKADMHLFIPDARNVTPLEVAVEDASRFPQDHLGLLAPCLAESSTNMSYFDDVKHIAEVTPEGALNLVRNIAEKGKENSDVLRRFRVCAQMDGKSDQMASIFYTAPLAAGEMLDLLEIEPFVEDPAHHSIPTKTSLWGLFQNIPMRCTYQPDIVKKEGLEVPSWDWKGRPPESFERRGEKFRESENKVNWHDGFAPRPRRAARNSYIKRVRVVASLMPGLLDIDVFMAFAQVQQEHLAIMSKKTVQGAILCLWGNVVEQVWAVRGIFLFFDMVAYVTVSGLIQANMHYGSLCWPIIVAGNFNALAMVVTHNISLIQKWSSHGSDSTMSAMWSPLSRWNLFYSVPMLLQAILGSIFVVDFYIRKSDETKVPPRSYIDDVLLASCLLISCFRFIWMWRLSVIGSRIYSICQTFLAGAVNQVLFITFLLLFAFITALMVLCRLHTARLAVLAYRGFLFGDGDGFNEVGMHIDEGETPWIDQNGALTGFAVFGSFFFNVIVLNIIIAIYGNEYDRVQQDTPGLFMQGRADYCVKSVLSTYIIPWCGSTVNEILKVSSLLAILAAVVLGKLGGIDIFLSAALLTFGQVLLPMAMIQCDWFSPEGQDADDRQRYLWMCHSRDWHWTTDMNNKMGEEVEAKEDEIEDHILALDEKVSSLDSKMDQIVQLLQSQGNGQQSTPLGQGYGPQSTPLGRVGSLGALS